MVLPWSAGKWLGSRGALMKELVMELPPDGIFIGDSALRPRVVREPAVFKLASKRGIKVLSGSDPLPLEGEERRVASIVSSWQSCFDDGQVSESVRQGLLDPKLRLSTYGDRITSFKLVKTLINLRADKRKGQSSCLD